MSGGLRRREGGGEEGLQPVISGAGEGDLVMGVTADRNATHRNAAQRSAARRRRWGGDRPT